VCKGGGLECWVGGGRERERIDNLFTCSHLVHTTRTRSMGMGEGMGADPGDRREGRVCVCERELRGLFFDTCKSCVECKSCDLKRVNLLPGIVPNPCAPTPRPSGPFAVECPLPGARGTSVCLTAHDHLPSIPGVGAACQEPVAAAPA